MKIAEVVIDRVVRGLDRTLSYELPLSVRGVEVGSRVRVPLGSAKAIGIVLRIDERSSDRVLKPIIGPVDSTPLLGPEMIELAQWMAEYYVCYLPQAIRAMIPRGIRRGVAPATRWHYRVEGHRAGRNSAKQSLWRWLAENPLATIEEIRQAIGDKAATALRSLVAEGTVVSEHYDGPRPVHFNARRYPLNPDQVAVVEEILAGTQNRWLLEGVTGSGKTEVYLDVIEKVLRDGGQVLVLIPEIALTPQTLQRFTERFSHGVYVWHSGLSDGQRVRIWFNIRQPVPAVVIAARSGVFLPFARLRLVVLDEEQEATYKQEEHPSYHAREVALWRAEHIGATVIVGSATPSLESGWAARQGQFGWLRLPSRVLDRRLPEVQIVDMREELEGGNRGIFSQTLLDAIDEALAHGHQVLLFLNRRGFSTFILCRACGQTLDCPHCAVTLTYHQDHDRLLCHYCDYTGSAPAVCPKCQSPKIRHFGAGTERVVAEVEKRWPEARVVRADRDTLKTRDSYEKLYQTFLTGGADVLVGTQMIAKGMDFPRVTVVGIVAADMSLHFPDFRSGERTFQLLVQAGGRAGRGEVAGRVVVQTYNPEHYAIQQAVSQDVDCFFEEELPLRQELSYPPYGALWLLEVDDLNMERAAGRAGEVAAYLTEILGEVGAQVMGPTPAPLLKIRNHFRYHILVKVEVASKSATAHLLAGVRDQYPDVRLTTDPYMML